MSNPKSENPSTFSYEDDPQVIQELIKTERYQIIEELFKLNNIPVDFRWESGLNSLQIAVIYGNEPVVLGLLQDGADLYVSSKNIQGQVQNLLHLAVLSNKIRIVEILLNAGLFPTETDISSPSPLEMARQNNQVQIIRLMEQYLNPDTSNDV
jgi:ankyrin repeat protein